MTVLPYNPEYEGVRLGFRRAGWSSHSIDKLRLNFSKEMQEEKKKNLQSKTPLVQKLAVNVAIYPDPDATIVASAIMMEILKKVDKDIDQDIEFDAYVFNYRFVVDGVAYDYLEY